MGGILVPPLMGLDVEVGPVIQPLSLSLPTCEVRIILPTVVLSGVSVRITWDKECKSKCLVGYLVQSKCSGERILLCFLPFLSSSSLLSEVRCFLLHLSNPKLLTVTLI